jgi:hypothetical protein
MSALAAFKTFSAFNFVKFCVIAFLATLAFKDGVKHYIQASLFIRIHLFKRKYG